MYELIEHKKLVSATASITFSNIPQIYTDLYLVTSLRDDSGSAGWATAEIRPNGLTTNISARVLYGFSTTVGSFTDTQIYHQLVRGASTASTFSNSSVYIPNYMSSTSKSFSVDTSGERNDAASINAITAGLWSVNDPITSLSIVPPAGSNLAQYSSATLYGINRTQAIGKPKAIGGNITFANGHWYHTFTGSGTFYAQEDLEVDALVVAGGGGGGGYWGGGGGAGGALTVSKAVISPGSYPLTVGAGGPGGSGVDNETLSRGSFGASSSFLNFNAVGGGAGGGNNQALGILALSTGGNGGSGGGGGVSGTTGYPGGAGTAGQGFAGGNGLWSSGVEQRSGGGGGASSAGGNYQSSAGGVGGAGIFWNGSYYAGGGAGGSRADRGNSVATGGIGGGGNSGVAGVANTGGGGGGQMYPGSASGSGASGGSGIVVIRYSA